jgi:hypothetical protein
MAVRLTDRELATVLAALRQWQMDWEADPTELADSPQFERGVEPLNSEEIDDLCEKLNRTEPGTPLGFFAREALEMNRRGLLCRLRDARKKLAHHKGSSASGREAKKEILAIEDELRRRGQFIPPEGRETAEWEARKQINPEESQ